MINNGSVKSSCADPRANGDRGKFHRARNIKWHPKSLITDGLGNITSRPLTKMLPCFGDPIEWLLGRGDKKRTYRDKPPEPKRCAGCPVSAFCAKVAWERIQSVPEIVSAHDAWEKDSYFLDYIDRYKSLAWQVLVAEIDRFEWLDSNDDELMLDRERQREASRLKTRKQPRSPKKGPKRTKKVPLKIREAIQSYRDDRVEEMLAQEQNAAGPLVIRNRSRERLVLMGDAWQQRELLEREGRASSGRAVFERLREEGKIPPGSPKSMPKRVEEILRRVNGFIDEGDWPYFDPNGDTQPSSGRYGFHPDCVFEILEDTV